MSEARRNKPPAVIEEPKVPALTDDEFDGVTGVGLETRTADELITPFLYVLQANSKAVTRGAPEYVEGAQAGMFLNSATRKLYDEIEFIPVEREYKFTRWVPIDPQAGLNGGFRGVYEADDPMVVRLRSQQGKFKKLRFEEIDDVTEFIETFSLYALIGSPGFTIDEAEQIVMPFTSIKIGRYKLWYDAAKKIRYQTASGVVQPAIYQHRWRMKAVFEQKWKPNGAFNVLISLAGEKPIEALVRKSDPLFTLAKEFNEALSTGRGRADYSRAQQDVEHDPLAGGPDGEIPF